jgi:hypothetical protein
MLYNIGLCQHKLGQLPAARDTYRRFLEERPNSKARPKVEQKIAEIDATLKKQGGTSNAPAGATDVLPPPPPPTVYKRTGLQIYADLGFGGLTSNPDDKTTSYTPTFGASAAIGVGVQHRPLPYLAYGMRMSWSNLTVADSQGNSIGDGWFFNIAGQAEFYPFGLLLKWTRLDPYIGIGIGYGQVTAILTGTNYNYDLELYGATLQVSTGVNVFLNSWISLGLAIRYNHGFWTTACVKSGGCGSPDQVGNAPGLFVIGIEGGFHLL